MSLQARMSPSDPRLYSANRDLAHNFEFVIQTVAGCLEDGKWPALTALARERGVSDETLGLCCQALCKFVYSQADNKKESMAQALARCGFLDLPDTARVVVMAYLGNVILGMHFAGVREATLGGQGPAMTYRQLALCGQRAAALMTMPRWRRRLYALRAWAKRTWRAVTNKDTNV